MCRVSSYRPTVQSEAATLFRACIPVLCTSTTIVTAATQGMDQKTPRDMKRLLIIHILTINHNLPLIVKHFPLDEIH
jgi:hypothetical protein